MKNIIYYLTSIPYKSVIANPTILKKPVDISDRNLIMGSLYGIDGTAERIRNIYAVMTYLHQGK